jgi:hypothetical protein
MKKAGKELESWISKSYPHPLRHSVSKWVNENKYMKKIIVFFTLAVLLAPCFSLADGGMINFDPYSGRWDYSDETNQQAFINYENGTEKMILSVGVGDLNEGKTMWIFPVPADPSKVVVDVVTKLPNLRGEEISEKAQSNLDDAKKWLQATQLFALPWVFASRSTLGTSDGFGATSLPSSSLGGSFKSALRPDVVVYEHLEKEGLTSEIVTARTAEGFDEYFSKKGLKIDANSIPVLQNYIGKEYSFVVSWIERKDFVLTRDDIEEIINSMWSGSGAYLDERAQANKLVQELNIKYPGFSDKAIRSSSKDTKLEFTENEMNDFKRGIKDQPEILKLLDNGKNQKGVFVSFPTDKIYFPLMPTSVYGSKIVPAEIRIMGHVTPDVFSDIKSFTKTEYYWDESIQFDKELKAFYSGQGTDINYTKIEINAPSKFFTNDLWVKNSASLKTYYQLFFAKQFWLIVLFLIIICSALAGWLTGWLVFREWKGKERLKKFGLIGLANCLTILGLVAAILPSKTKKDSEDIASIIQAIKAKGYYWRKRLALGLIIADLPFLLISIFAIPLSIIELSSMLARHNAHNSYYNDFLFNIILQMLLSFLPIIVLVAVWFLAKIKKEDQQLFSDLTSKNYSVFTFQPKDKRKAAFIFLYSVFFLIISWAVVMLLIFSVGGS